jgi:hypothetical protein
MGRWRLSLPKLALVSLFSMLLTSTLFFIFFTPQSSHNLSFQVNQTDIPIPITLNPNTVALYLNFTDRYPCPYYSDRADFISPEVNRLAQFLRTFGVKIIFYTTSFPSTSVSGSIPVPEITTEHLSETSPGFQDFCIFEKFTDSPTWQNTAIHRNLLYSSSADLFVDSADQIVRLAIHRKLTHLMVAGMKCNLWIPSLFEKLKISGVNPIWIADLSDVAFYRKSQIDHFMTHLEAAARFRNWVSGRGYGVVNHWDVLNQQQPEIPKKVAFDGNWGAFFFDWYWATKV